MNAETETIDKEPGKPDLPKNDAIEPAKASETEGPAAAESIIPAVAGAEAPAAPEALRSAPPKAAPPKASTPAPKEPVTAGPQQPVIADANAAAATVIKKPRTWPWVLLTAAMLLAGGALVFINLNQLGEIWKNYQQIISVVMPFAISAFLFLWLVPKFSIRSLRSLQNEPFTPEETKFSRKKDTLTMEDNYRKTLAEIIGGALVVIGLVITYNTYVLNLDLYKDGQIKTQSARFASAESQLINENLESRINALSTFEQMSKESSEYNKKAAESAVTFIRGRAHKTEAAKKADDGSVKKPAASAEEKPLKELDVDIQKALSIIGKRTVDPQDPAKIEIDLSEANLPKADFSILNFAGANLKKADLRGAIISDANFSGAFLAQADLRDAIITRVDFAKANFLSADLRGTKLHEVDFSDVELFWVDFSGTDLSTTTMTAEQIEKIIIDKDTVLPDQYKELRDALLKSSAQIIRDREKR